MYLPPKQPSYHMIGMQPTLYLGVTPNNAVIKTATRGPN
jgi:hypothetical protein